MKKILCLLLTLSLCLTASLLPARAENEVWTEGDFQYDLVSGAARIVKYTGRRGDDVVVTVPEVIGGYTVKHIGSYAFSGQFTEGKSSFLKRVILPDTIESIGGDAFFETGGSASDEGINLPANLKYIAPGAFYGATIYLECEFKSEYDPILVFPEKLQYIGYQAFACSRICVHPKVSSTGQSGRSFFMSVTESMRFGQEIVYIHPEAFVPFWDGVGNEIEYLVTYKGTAADGYFDNFEHYNRWFSFSYYRKGDVNHDGNITVSDVVALRMAIVDNDEKIELDIADLDEDGAATVSDVIALRDKIVHLVTYTPEWEKKVISFFKGRSNDLYA